MRPVLVLLLRIAALVAAPGSASAAPGSIFTVAGTGTAGALFRASVA